MCLERMERRYNDYGDEGFDWWQAAIVVMFILMAAGILSACKTKYVSVPEYHKEYIVRSDTLARVDSVVLHDSIFVYNTGDTVIVNKVAYRDRVRNVYKVRTDTVVKTDSVRVPCEVAEGQQAKKATGCTELVKLSVCLILAILLVGLVMFLRERRKMNTNG